jgi:hypothetical protein
MTGVPALLKRSARALWLTSSDETLVRSHLGGQHPLTRIVAVQRVISAQVVVAALAVFAGLVGLALDVHGAVLALATSSVVAIAFGSAWMSARRVAYDRTVQAIAADEGTLIPLVARERRRLASREQRERLARSLEWLHRDALRWYAIPPSYRPLDGVRRLRETSREALEVIARLRAEHVHARGVAMTVRLLMDGGESPLYADNAERLREELNRIKYALEARRPDEHDPGLTHEAA